jgi:ABC-type Fe3+ transport system substrate-binding protein
MKKHLALAMVAYASFALAQASAQTVPDWEKKWNQLVADAKKEGKVVIIAPPDPQVRAALPAAFKAKYGITVDYLGGRSSETAAKMRAERNAGVHTVDVALSGIQTMAAIFYREKMIDPIDDTVLIHPEVTEGKYWKRGKPWFMDPEGKYVLRLFNTVSAMFFLNTALIKPEEMKSGKDLLNPKWKGKIVAHDPTVPGTGSNDAARLYVQYGEDFIKKLYIDQQPRILRDRRQITDGIMRGSFAIALGAEDDDMEKLAKEGIPVVPIYELSDLPGSTSAGVGQLALMSNAPHPNAAKLFINWMASKEGMELFSRTRGGAPTRNDVNELSFLPAENVPKPGVDYFDTYDWEFTLSTKEKIRERMGELLRK